ncbi:hypothetical protein AVEN_227216-1, partial [Araneus ventricosus]
CSQLVTSLRGSAAEVLQGIPSDKLTDLTTTERALEARYGDSHLIQFYRTELKTIQQKPGESLQVLAADVERLMSLAYAACPQDVRDSLAAQYFVDANRDEDTHHATSHVAGKKTSRRNPNVTCWKCNKKGHVQRECQTNFPKQEKLMNDRLTGRRLPFLNKAPERGLKVSALCGGRNGLYFEGSICGIPCLMLVDTGGNVTLVKTDLALKLKKNFIYTALNISLKTATGEKAEIHGKLDAVIECGCRKFQHRTYVADITDPCILGLDSQQKFNFTVDLEKNEIRTGGEEIPLFSASAEHSKLCSVLAKEKTIIPARLECLIQGAEVSGKFRYAVTDFPSQVSQKGVLVAATLVDLKRETIPFRVLNLDNKPKTVDKGAVIATCELVVDIVARPQEFSEKLRFPLTL